MHELPISFVARIEQDLPDESSDLLQALGQNPSVSILVNSAKNGHQFAAAEPVAWCPSGFYLPERPKFTFDPLFHAGCYYPMEAASMSIATVLQSCLTEKERPLILDLCAAPGGKSAVIANFLDRRGVLVANEVNRRRYPVLRDNLTKLGTPNICTSNLDPAHIAADGAFDLVLVDAPCSGEGMFRKDPKALQEWSPEHVRHCAMRQYRILKEAQRLVTPGGFLAYSTCTYAHDENIMNADLLCASPGWKSIDIRLDTYGAVRIVGRAAIGYQFYPHRTRGEGLFVSVVRKAESSYTEQPELGRHHWLKSIPRSHAPLAPFISPTEDGVYELDNQNMLRAIPAEQSGAVSYLAKKIRGLRYGVQIGTVKRDSPVPAHDLALSKLAPIQYPRLELNLEEAITYLRKEQPRVAMRPPGWYLATFNGAELGWIKSDGSRWKNYLPTHLRIRMRQST